MFAPFSGHAGAVKALLQKLKGSDVLRFGSRAEAETADIDDEPADSGFESGTVVPFAMSLAMVVIATAALFAAKGVLPLLNLTLRRRLILLRGAARNR